MMHKFTVNYYITDEQMQKLHDLREALDAKGVVPTDSIEDLFDFLMQWGSAHDVDKRIELMREMAARTPKKERHARANERTAGEIQF